MTPTERKILDFVGAEFLHGDTTGLTIHTRLLELNIIDSLGAMILLSFVERDLGVVIDLQDVGADTLRDVSTIADLIDRKRGALERPGTA